jgi:hypothetical protein
LEIGIERHGRKASERGSRVDSLSSPPPARRAFGSPPSTRPLCDARHFWDYRCVLLPPKVQIGINIERHGRKTSGRGPGSSSCRGRHLHAERLAHHILQRAPLCDARHFYDYRGWIPPSKVLLEIVIERRGRKASGTGRGTSSCRGRLPKAEHLAHPQRAPLGAARNFETTEGGNLFQRDF